jgi:hypothetical protein
LVQKITDISVKIDIYMQRQEDLIKEFGITNKEFYQFKETVISTDKERQRNASLRRWVIGASIPLIATFIALAVNYGCKKMELLENRIDTTYWEYVAVPRGVDSLNLEPLNNANIQ